MENKLKLYGFNNLTKSLSFNIYDVCYAKTPKAQLEYIAYVDEVYNSERITDIMTHLTEMIGAQVLSVSRQDYDPQGASATFLIADDTMIPAGGSETVAHLDKSHVTVHTYPEYHPDTSIATFRVDIDVATCGKITPLTALDYLIGSFDSRAISTARSSSSTTTSPRYRTTSTLPCSTSTMRSISTYIRQICSTRKCS